MVPSASMADIAFLLIIFFILTTQFMQDANIKLELPEAPDIEKVDKTPVTLSIDEDGVIWVMGEECDTNAVEALIGVKLRDRKDKIVHFKCDAALTRDAFEPIIIAIADAGGLLVPLGDKAIEPPKK